jgi:hypothetical protein
MGSHRRLFTTRMGRFSIQTVQCARYGGRPRAALLPLGSGCWPAMALVQEGSGHIGSGMSAHVRLPNYLPRCSLTFWAEVPTWATALFNSSSLTPSDCVQCRTSLRSCRSMRLLSGARAGGSAAGEKPKATWVEPSLPAEIACGALTAEKRLRAPVFEGIREDLLDPKPGRTRVRKSTPRDCACRGSTPDGASERVG